jgi:hypothetical protein
MPPIVLSNEILKKEFDGSQVNKLSPPPIPRSPKAKNDTGTSGPTALGL